MEVKTSRQMLSTVPSTVSLVWHYIITRAPWPCSTGQARKIGPGYVRLDTLKHGGVSTSRGATSGKQNENGLHPIDIGSLSQLASVGISLKFCHPTRPKEAGGRTGGHPTGHFSGPRDSYTSAGQY